ncbi:hypothetical protein T09_10280, partial [Trichinella sp. T9]
LTGRIGMQGVAAVGLPATVRLVSDVAAVDEALLAKAVADQLVISIVVVVPKLLPSHTVADAEFNSLSGVVVERYFKVEQEGVEYSASVAEKRGRMVLERGPFVSGASYVDFFFKGQIFHLHSTVQALDVVSQKHVLKHDVVLVELVTKFCIIRRRLREVQNPRTAANGGMVTPLEGCRPTGFGALFALLGCKFGAKARHIRRDVFGRFGQDAYTDQAAGRFLLSSCCGVVDKIAARCRPVASYGRNQSFRIGRHRK